MHQEGGRKKKKKKLWVISGENSLRTAGCFHSLPFSYKGESKDLADFSKTFLLQVTTFIAVCVLMGHS